MRRSLKLFYFTIDLRSLGLFRILLGCLLILDWLMRWPDLEAFYTSFGVLPVDAPLPKSGGEFHFCLLDGVTSLFMTRFAFCAGLIFYLCFAAGYRTRLFQALSFVFFTSVLSRNVLLRDGSVVVMATMLMWSLFLPVGRRFSVDACLERLRFGVGPDCAETGCSRPSLAAFAIVAQIGMIYLFTAIAKSGDTWKDGTALYYALNVDQLVRPFGRWVLSWPLSFLKGATWTVLGVEYLALPLILAPFAQPWLRRIAIGVLVLLHASIASMMHLGFFAAVMASTFSLLLLPADWEALKRWPLSSWLQQRVFNGFSMAQSAEVQPNKDFKMSLLAARFKFWSTNLLAAALFLTFSLDAYNINAAKALGYDRLTEPRWMRALVEVPLLEHNWELFAPDPMKDDGWWVIDGDTECGDKLDPLTGKPPDFEKPLHLSSDFDRFWRKYLERIWLKKNYDHRLYFGKYLTKRNHRDFPKGQRLVRFSFYYIKERTQPPGTPQPWPNERLLLWRHECFEKKPAE